MEFRESQTQPFEKLLLKNSKIKRRRFLQIQIRRLKLIDMVFNKISYITVGVIFRKYMMTELQAVCLIVSATFGSGFFQIGAHFRSHLLFCKSFSLNEWSNNKTYSNVFISIQCVCYHLFLSALFSTL
jgi:hypothetical protein